MQTKDWYDITNINKYIQMKYIKLGGKDMKNKFKKLKKQIKGITLVALIVNSNSAFNISRSNNIIYSRRRWNI